MTYSNNQATRKPKMMLIVAAFAVALASMLTLGVGASPAAAADAGNCDPADLQGNTTCMELDCVDGTNGLPDCILIEECHHGNGDPITSGACDSAAVRNTNGSFSTDASTSTTIPVATFSATVKTVKRR